VVDQLNARRDYLVNGRDGLSISLGMVRATALALRGTLELDALTKIMMARAVEE